MPFEETCKEKQILKRRTTRYTACNASGPTAVSGRTVGAAGHFQETKTILLTSFLKMKERRRGEGRLRVSGRSVGSPRGAGWPPPEAEAGLTLIPTETRSVRGRSVLLIGFTSRFLCSYIIFTSRGHHFGLLQGSRVHYRSTNNGGRGHLLTPGLQPRGESRLGRWSDRPLLPCGFPDYARDTCVGCQWLPLRVGRSLGPPQVATSAQHGHGSGREQAPPQTPPPHSDPLPSNCSASRPRTPS